MKIYLPVVAFLPGVPCLCDPGPTDVNTTIIQNQVSSITIHHRHRHQTNVATEK